jgi:surface antigen
VNPTIGSKWVLKSPDETKCHCWFCDSYKGKIFVVTKINNDGMITFSLETKPTETLNQYLIGSDIGFYEKYFIPASCEDEEEML